MKISSLLVLVPALCALAVGPAARASTNGFFVPFFRSSPNSESGYWETFTVPVGAPGNLPDKEGAKTGAILTQTESNAFLTGSGNIYNVAGTSSFIVADRTPFALGTVVLLTRTLGAELNYGAVVLNYTNRFGEQTLAPSSHVELDRRTIPGLGTGVSSFWQWDLRGINVSNYWLSFGAAAPSLSFDSMTLDSWDQFAPLFAAPFKLSDTSPVIERWMYPFNAAPCDRPAGSTFGTLASDSGVDSRHAQHLVGWDTAAWIPTNQAPTRYLLRSCRVSFRINRGDLFAFDPTQDGYRTYFETNHPAYLVDDDEGRPIELFGVGYRNGFDVTTFDQCGLFGSSSPGQRNAFAAGWSTNGLLVDVSNNVGKTNDGFPRFEVSPFAIGQTTNAAPGQLVSAGARITFDLNLEDPFVLAYLRSALNVGRLRLMITSLHPSGGQSSLPSYPDFMTHFNEVIVDPTRLELEGVVVSDGDVDGDGLPDDWEAFYFGTLSHDGASDPDGDGANTLLEYRAGTDPLRPASVLRLMAGIPGSNHHVSLLFQHSANHLYEVDFSENLQDWIGLTNAPVYLLGTNIVEWRDETPSDSRRFYRVRVRNENP